MPKRLGWEPDWEFSQEWTSDEESVWCQNIDSAEHDWTTRLEYSTNTARVIVVCCGWCEEMRVITERAVLRAVAT